MYMHQISGLNLTYFRAYDPNTAKWLSRDPLGERGGINLYGYVGNNPIWAIDPFGLETYFTHYTGLDDGYRVDGIYASAAVGVAAITVATAGSADAIAAALATRFPWLIPAAAAAKKVADGINGQTSCPTASPASAITPAVRNAMYNGGIDKLSPAEREAAAAAYDQVAATAKTDAIRVFNEARAAYARNGGTPPGGITPK
jgi:RHS repeat-associated protein